MDDDSLEGSYTVPKPYIITEKSKTVSERMIDFISQKERSGRELVAEFGNNGNIWSNILKFTNKEIINDRICECGNSHFYSLKHIISKTHPKFK